MNHIKKECTDKSCDGVNCNTCNLFTCDICGASEGQLPTSCPGFKMKPETKDAIYAGKVDYLYGQWVNK